MRTCGIAFEQAGLADSTVPGFIVVLGGIGAKAQHTLCSLGTAQIDGQQQTMVQNVGRRVSSCMRHVFKLFRLLLTSVQPMLRAMSSRSSMPLTASRSTRYASVQRSIGESGGGVSASSNTRTVGTCAVMDAVVSAIHDGGALIISGTLLELIQPITTNEGRSFRPHSEPPVVFFLEDETTTLIAQCASACAVRFRPLAGPVTSTKSAPTTSCPLNQS